MLDGFPRTIEQADWLYAQHKAGLVNITCVLHFEASQEVVLQRLLGRGRQDDTKESISKRFAEYEKVTLPILQDFSDKGIKVFHINAENSTDDVHAEALGAVAK